MRHEVETFAQCMEHKLQKNDHKGGWEQVPMEHLFELMRQEVDELEQAMKNEPTLNAVFEAADVANFAMMIAWNALRQLVTPVARVTPTQYPTQLFCLECNCLIDDKMEHGGHHEKCSKAIPF